MNKKNAFIFVGLLLSLLAPLASWAGVKISLRLHGGLSYLDASDVNAGTQAFFDWGKAYFAPSPGGAIAGGYEAVHWGYEFGGEIIFELSPRIGIGIGAGYLEMAKNPSTYPGMMIISDNPAEGGAVRHFCAGTTLRSIPLQLAVFLTLPINQKFNFLADAGVSCYLKPRYEGFWLVIEDSSLLEPPWQSMSTVADKNQAGLGFQAGLGIEYNLLTKAALFVEAHGRYARFRGFEGTSVWEQGPWGGPFPPFSETGKLYYESVPAIPDSPRWIMVQNAPPPGPGGQSREAIVDFSGVSIQAGVRIHF